MKTLIASLFLCVIAASGLTASAHEGMVHLKFKGGAIHAHAEWLQGPTNGQESILQLSWKDGASHTPMDFPGTFNVTISMPDMPEMKNPPTQLTRVLDGSGMPMTGEYKVSSIFFTMGGTWDVQVNVTYSDGSTETQSFEFSFDDDMKM